MPLQLRRGNTAEVGSITPSIGELVYDTQLKRVNVGDGSTAGGVPIAGVTTNEAKDAAAASLLAGTHQNISFTYNSTTKALSARVDILTHDTVEADAVITDKIFNSSSTLIVDVATGTFNGNLNGNVTGNVSGNLTGNVTGNLTGNVSTYLISSPDSSSILVDTPINFQTDVLTDGISTFLDEIAATTTSTTQRLLSVTQIHNSASSSSGVNFRRSRGTTSSFSSVTTGDNLGNILFTGFDGSIYSQSALIRTTVDGTITSGRIPGKIGFLTVSDLTGELTEKMYIGSRNDIRINAELQIVTDTYETAPITSFQQSHSTVDVRNVSWIRTRGTVDSPTVVQNGDKIADLVFQGSDGVNSIPPVAAALTVNVDSAVGPNDVRARFAFATYNGTSLANRVIIDSTGLLRALNNFQTNEISPTSTNGDLVLDPTSKGIGTINFKAPEQSTVGAAGAASALPATPSTYLKVKINGSTYVIPAYAAS